MEPNCVIFRIDDFDDGTPQFVELEIEDGRVAQSGRTFGVKPGDSYLELDQTRIIFARLEEGGSTDLIWTTVFNKSTGESTIVVDLPYVELNDLVQRVLESEFTSH